jgi:phosphoglycerate dehydrogenase-like enzyme
MEEKTPAILFGYTPVMSNVYPDRLRKEIGREVSWLRMMDEVPVPAPDGSWEGVLPEETEVIFTTWGMPRLTGPFLDALPRLKAVFYAAGSVRGIVTEASWKRGIRIFSAARANAVPVAEFTVAQIVLGLKQTKRLRMRTAGDWEKSEAAKLTMQGNYRTRVGLISYGAIARLVRQKLRVFEHEVWVYDPFLTEEEADEEGIHLCSLETLFAECPVVSLHAPLLEATRGMVRGHHFRSMLPDGVFINTSRGAIVDQDELVEAMRERPDLTAVLDVLREEPPTEGDPVFDLPNIWVYPHLAGSMGLECERMGRMIFSAFQAFRDGGNTPLEVTEEDMDRMA